MPEKKFDLGDYVEVKDRIRVLYELDPQARLVTSEVTVLTAPDDKQRVMVKALAYRHPEDPLPGVGYSWLEIPGTTPYTKGSEVENAETSAWGRAIGSLGILIDASIASRQEVEGKQVPTGTKTDDDGWTGPRDKRGRPAEEIVLLGEVARSGKIAKGDAAGYKLDARETPDGHAIGFRLQIAKDKAIPQVLAEGAIGEMLFVAVAGQPETLWKQDARVRGRLYEVHPGPNRDTTFRLVLSRIETAEFVIPADSEEPEPVAPGQEPLFDETEQAAIGAAVEAAPAGSAV